MATRPAVIVIGAGIIGASIAWHLARQCADVTVVEAGEPGGIATRNSWAWINASMSPSEAYFRLRASAMAEWRRLEQQLQGMESGRAADHVLGALRELFDPLVSVALDSHQAGRRPIPGDGLPLVGLAQNVAGLYVAVTHSGVTLAPSIGRMVADEIVMDRRDPLLAPFGLARLSTATTRKS